MLLQRFGELCIIDETVVVFVIVLQDIVDENDEVLLFHRLAVLSSLLFVYMCDSCGELQPIQQVVAIVVVHLEIVQLELLGCHFFLWLVDHSLQMLHDVVFVLDHVFVQATVTVNVSCTRYDRRVLLGIHLRVDT